MAADYLCKNPECTENRDAENPHFKYLYNSLVKIFNAPTNGSCYLFVIEIFNAPTKEIIPCKQTMGFQLPANIIKDFVAKYVF